MRLAPSMIGPPLLGTPASVIRSASAEDRARLRGLCDHLLAHFLPRAASSSTSRSPPTHRPSAWPTSLARCWQSAPRMIPSARRLGPNRSSTRSATEEPSSIPAAATLSSVDKPRLWVRSRRSFAAANVFPAAARFVHFSTNFRSRSSVASHWAEISSRQRRTSARRRVSISQRRSRPTRSLLTMPICSSSRKCLVTACRETPACFFNRIVGSGPSALSAKRSPAESGRPARRTQGPSSIALTCERSCFSWRQFSSLDEPNTSR